LALYRRVLKLQDMPMSDSEKAQFDDVLRYCRRSNYFVRYGSQNAIAAMPRVLRRRSMEIDELERSINTQRKEIKPQTPSSSAHLHTDHAAVHQATDHHASLSHKQILEMYGLADDSASENPSASLSGSTSSAKARSLALLHEITGPPVPGPCYENRAELYRQLTILQRIRMSAVQQRAYQHLSAEYSRANYIAGLGGPDCFQLTGYALQQAAMDLEELERSVNRPHN
jgi:hypothetical protein